MSWIITNGLERVASQRSALDDRSTAVRCRCRWVPTRRKDKQNLEILLLICRIFLALAIAAYGWTGPRTSALADVVDPASNSPCRPAAHCAPAQSLSAFVDLFTYVAAIPQTVLVQGDTATTNWVRGHPRGGERSRATLDLRSRWAADPVGCAVAVGSVLTGVLAPAAKLLKLREYIRVLGGVYQAAKYLVVIGSAGDRTEAVAIAVGSLIAELSGIKGVGEKCFR
jgi:hypothetical protein